MEQASKFCENLCNDFVSIASSSESAGKTILMLLKIILIGINVLGLMLKWFLHSVDSIILKREMGWSMKMRTPLIISREWWMA